MTTQLRRVRAVTLEDKLAYWISRGINVLFRCGPGISVAAEVSSALHKSGLSWRAISARCRTDWALVGSCEEALFINDLDRMPTKIRPAVLNMLADRMIWATVGVSEDDFDQETADLFQAEDFDIVVDVPCCA